MDRPITERLREAFGRLGRWLRASDEQRSTLLGWLLGVSRQPPAWTEDEDGDS